MENGMKISDRWGRVFLGCIDENHRQIGTPNTYDGRLLKSTLEFCTVLKRSLEKSV